MVIMTLFIMSLAIMILVITTLVRKALDIEDTSCNYEIS